MTDYYKHKVASMGRTVLETKLTANGVLSNSVDLTAWHVDYIHKVVMFLKFVYVTWRIQFCCIAEGFLLSTVFFCL